MASAEQRAESHLSWEGLPALGSGERSARPYFTLGGVRGALMVVVASAGRFGGVGGSLDYPPGLIH